MAGFWDPRAACPVRSIVTLHGAGRTVPGLSPCPFPSAADPDCCIRKPRHGLSVHRPPKPTSASTAPASEEGVLRFWHQLCPRLLSPPSHPSTSPFLPLLSPRNRPLGPLGPPASSLKDRFCQDWFLLCSLSVFSYFCYSLKKLYSLLYIY